MSQSVVKVVVMTALTVFMTGQKLQEVHCLVMLSCVMKAWNVIFNM